MSTMLRVRMRALRVMLAGALAMALSACGVEAPAEEAEPRPLLAPLFHDAMVLQRDAPITLFGHAPAGADVDVALNGAALPVRRDGTGGWTATLEPQPASRGNVLTVQAADGAEARVENVAFGDVWLCSGQSNMDWTLAQAANGERLAQQATRSGVHIAKVARDAPPAPADDPQFAISWRLADAEAALDFSAVCWHFGLELARTIDAPIGLIQAALGGTTIEDWIGADHLEQIARYRPDLERVRAFAADPVQAEATMAADVNAWAAAHDPGSDPQAPWYGDDVSLADWTTLPQPGQWERSGVDALRGFDGVVWLRRDVEVTAEQAQGAATLALGRIDERDTVWINGVKVGQTFWLGPQRVYPIPDGVLRAGANSIAIRVIDLEGGGGLRGGVEGALPLSFADGSVLDVAGAWRAKPSISRRAWEASPPFVPWTTLRGLTTLYNGMIAPLAPTTLRGVVWYQGESNIRRYYQYRELMDVWMGNWRDTFADPDLPFIIAQLPGYGPYSAKPSPASPLAHFREAQRQAVAADGKAGMAILLDQGVRNDIHPAHKDVVGARLAQEALRVAYGATDVQAAPTLRAVTRKGTQLRVRFADTGGGLTVYGGAAALGFTVCDGDDACRFAPGSVQGDTVVLELDDEPAQTLRYAWANFPLINLYGRSGLPVAPFTADIPAP